jgi:hypothetical protein
VAQLMDKIINAGVDVRLPPAGRQFLAAIV